MSCFGEISEPSTRTAWEDWDDELNESLTKLCFQNTVDLPEEISTFLILEGRYLYNCVRDLEGIEHINSVPEVNLHLYKTKEDNNYICVIKDYNLVQSSEIIELLKDYITRSRDIIGLLTKPLVEYQVPSLIGTDYVLRSVLSTKKIPRKTISDVASLELPNIIAGVIAGAVCLREVLDKSAAALICYIDTQEQSISELFDILEQFKVMSLADKMKTNDVLLNSNLYI